MTLPRFRNFVFLSMVFLVPLAINPWGVDIYEIPKNTIFKLGVGLLGILWIVAAVRKKRIEVFLSKRMSLVLLFFFLVLGLSWFSSVRPSVSFWGAYYKQGGIVNMLYYLLLFVLALDFLQPKENRLLFLRILSWSGIFVSLYALVQKLGFDFLPAQIGDLFEGRSFSTLGNPSMLATFLLFPIGAELALYKKSHRSTSFCSLGIMFLALLASRGRAGLLGLLVVVLLLLFKRFRARRKALIALCGTGLLALAIFVGVYGSNTRSLESRFSLWQSSLHMIEDRPILGYGLENFAAIFPSYATADFYQTEDYMNTADRPHNEFLEFWIHLGVLGAIFYAGLIIFVLRRFWSVSDATQGIMSATLLAVFVSNFFGFSLVTHFTFIVLFLAMLCVENSRVIMLTKMRSLILAGIGIFLLLSSIFPIRFFTADLLFKNADNQFLKGNPKTAYDLVRQGQSYNSFFSELYTLSFKIDFGLDLVTEDRTYFEAAVLDNQKAYVIDGGSLKTMTSLVQVYTVQDRIEDAEKILLELDEKTSVNPLLNQITGEFYYQQERYEEAIVQYERLLELIPDDWQAPVLTDGDFTEASRIFWKNHPEFLTILQHLVDAYQKTGSIDSGKELLLKLT